MGKNTRPRGHDLKAINWVRDHVRNLTLYERVLMQYLASRCSNDGTHSCWPEQRTIAADLEIDRRTVIRYLKSLKEKGLISVKRRPNASCEYRLHVSGSDSQMSLPEVTRDDTSGSDSQMHHKEGTGSKETEGRNQKCYARMQPSADALGPVSAKQESRERGEVLAQNFQKRCKFDPAARLRFYMDCGRLHSKADHFHKPKDPAKPLTYLQNDALGIWFEQLPESGCYVMNYAMSHWPQLREAYNKTHDTKWNRLQTTPTISAIEKIGSNWKSGAEYLFELWKASQHHEMITRVESKILGEAEDFWGAS